RAGVVAGLGERLPLRLELSLRVGERAAAGLELVLGLVERVPARVEARLGVGERALALLCAALALGGLGAGALGARLERGPLALAGGAAGRACLELLGRAGLVVAGGLELEPARVHLAREVRQTRLLGGERLRLALELPLALGERLDLAGELLG